MSTGFTAQQKVTILFRDGDKCAMCGRRAREANHRANRGAGGHRGSNTLANGCALCHECNGAIESDAAQAELARARGVKISRHDDPRSIEYLSPLYQAWVLLDDTGGLTFVDATPQADPAAVPKMTPDR